MSTKVMHTRARTPRPVNPGDDELARAAQRVRETYGVMIEDSGGCNEAHTDHDGSAAADPAPYTCHLRNAAGPASSPMDARPASSNDPSKFPPVTPEHDVIEGEDVDNSTLNCKLLVDKDDNLNDVGDEDDSTEYGTIESGDDAERMT
ncbi:hypothetical protein C6341_g4893 [Phytophthora cactorum]|nr:hypothetical protein C6341_g4893 [Phytophthora cactorum]